MGIIISIIVGGIIGWIASIIMGTGHSRGRGGGCYGIEGSPASCRAVGNAIASKRDLTLSAVPPGIAKVRARCRRESQCAASGWHSAASGRGRMISRPAVAITNGTTSAL